MAIRKKLFERLSDPWIISCDKCGLRFPILMTDEGIAAIYKQGLLWTDWIDCENKDCMDGTKRHLIKFTLEDLIDGELKRARARGKR